MQDLENCPEFLDTDTYDDLKLAQINHYWVEKYFREFLIAKRGNNILKQKQMLKNILDNLDKMRDNLIFAKTEIEDFKKEFMKCL